MAAASASPVLAPHPFGVPEAGGAGPAWAGEFFGRISLWQSRFYRQLTGAVRGWQDGGAWLLVGLSFAYGVFHALGPGHGKAVISSYVLANRETVRNGALLALLSALVQALVAIALVALAGWALQLTGAAMNRATAWLETGSYAMVAMLGAWLVWSKALRPLWRRGGGHEGGDHDGHRHDHSHGHDHGHEHGHPHRDDCGCGHAHIPDPGLAAGRLDMAKAWSAVLSVGLRPCSGALVVLVFALSQGAFMAGVASALAMGLGTGITVAALACLALAAGGLASRLAGRRPAWVARVRYAIEALAAVAVLALGLLLLGGALSR